MVFKGFFSLLCAMAASVGLRWIASWVMLGEAAVSQTEVFESFVYPCAGREMERQVPADEVLRVAPNVS